MDSLHLAFQAPAPRTRDAAPAGDTSATPDDDPFFGATVPGTEPSRRRRRRRSPAAAPASAPVPAPDPVMVLLDVENQANRPATLRAVLAACREEAGDADVAVFAAVGSQNWARLEPLCRSLGIRVLPASAAKSAADKVLLGVAAAAATVRPETRFVVASGDHAFAQLGPVAVVTRNRAGVARTLAEAADRVRLVTDDDIAPVVSLAQRRAAADETPRRASPRTGRTRTRLRTRRGTAAPAAAVATG